MNALRIIFFSTNFNNITTGTDTQVVNISANTCNIIDRQVGYATPAYQTYVNLLVHKGPQNANLHAHVMRNYTD